MLVRNLHLFFLGCFDFLFFVFSLHTKVLEKKLEFVKADSILDIWLSKNSYQTGNLHLGKRRDSNLVNPAQEVPRRQYLNIYVVLYFW